MRMDCGPWYYAGPYVPSGVLYGKLKECNRSEWLIPGFDPDPPIHKINLYEKTKDGQ